MLDKLAHKELLAAVSQKMPSILQAKIVTLFKCGRIVHENLLQIYCLMVTEF